MLVAFLLGGATLACLLPQPAAAGVSASERKLVRAIGKVRAKHGLKRVRVSRSLSRSAGRYSRWQLRHNYFGHQARIRMSSRFDTRGEVLRLVMGRRVSVRRTLRLWLRSPSHRAAILHGSMRLAGAGIARGRFRGRRAVMVTVHLGAR